MKRNYITLLFIVISAMATVLVLNYYKIQKPLDVIIESDYRNKGIDISVHYGNYILPSTLVINVNQISGEKTPGDVFRVMLQLAEKLSDKDFEYIELSSKGVLKFTLKGEYFKLLGVQYNNQNPVYTIRTFPEKVYRPDGQKAFSSWTGGLLGVAGNQMRDFREFNQKWYIEDM